MKKLSLTCFGRFQAQLGSEPLAGFRTNKVQALLIYLANESAPQRRESLMILLWPGMPERSARHNLRQILYHLNQAIPELSPQSGENGVTAVPLLLANRQAIQLNPVADLSVDVSHFEAFLRQAQSHSHLDLLTCYTCRQTLTQAVDLYQGDFLADFYLDDSNEFEEWAEIKRQAYRRKALDALETLTTIATRQKAYPQAQAFAQRQLEIDNLHESAYRQLMEIYALNGRRSEALALYESCHRLLAEEWGMAPTSRTTDLYRKILAGDLRFDVPVQQGVRGYELKEEIGEGAYGTIYRAIQPAIGRDVAVKVIRRRYANDPEFIRRFETEAQTIARLEHPHIVPLYDYWRDPEGAYLVMRLLRGGSLLESLKAGPWSPEAAIATLDQIASALAAAHRQGIIHRDIKPANILFDEDGNAYLSDFGIAKDLGRDLQLTGGGGMMGTPDYISPEQLVGEVVTAQADQYSLGAILYEVLTGEQAFATAPIGLRIQKHLTEPLPLISESRPDAPHQIDEVIQRATAKQPSDRFPDVLALAEAYRQAVRQDTGRVIIPATAVPIPIEITNPYKGLRAFQESDAGDFYGREKLVHQLVSRLTPSPEVGEGRGGGRFLAVVGPSGSGKSSVVKAGLIPALRQGALPGSENWFVAEMVPGSQPLEELALALLPVAVDPPPSLIDPLQKDERGLLRILRRILPQEDAHLLLVIDQFEELFTLTDSEPRRNFFLNSLLAALTAPRSPLHVVVTLRADFYDRPLQLQPLAHLFKEHTELVLPMTGEELAWAIQEPARRVGVILEDGLVATMVNEVADQPGALPLLQYVLTELFEERQGQMMTLNAYHTLGGVKGALALRAEEIFEGLDATAQAATRQLFLRLVTLGEGVEDTRRRVQRSELEALSVNGNPLSVNGSPNTDYQIPITEYGNYRLLTFDHDLMTRQPTVEVAHEALLREWPRLCIWLDESRADVRLQRLLASATSEWLNADQNDSYLLHGSRLDQFEAWVHTTDIALTQAERNFLRASSQARQARQVAEEARRRRELETAHQLAETERQRAEVQTRAAQRLRQFVVGLAIFLAIALGATWFALVQRNTAQENFVASQRIRLTAQSQLALDRGEEATLPALLALRSLEYGYSPEADAALLTALSRGFSRQVYLGHTGPLSSATFSPDGKYVLTGSNDTTVRLWDRQSGQEVRQFPGHTDFVVAVFSPDGRQIMTGSADRTARFWDSETARELLRLPDHASAILAVAFSPDGRYVVTNDGSTARLWDAQTGEEVRQFEGHGETILGVSFSPNGRYLATASIDRTAVLWDLAAGQVIRTFAGHAAGVNEAIFSPDGRFLLTASLDTTARLWQVENGEVICSFLGHTRVVHDVAFSPDGRLVITGSGDKTARLWDAATCREVRRFIGHTGEVDSVAFSPDGRYVLTSSIDQSVRLWDVRAEIEPRLFAPPPGAIHADDVILLMFTPDGSQVLTGNGSGRVALWDIESRQIVQSSGFESGFINTMGFSPTGENVFTTGGDGMATLWDSRSGQPVRLFTGHMGPIWDATFSPDGKSVLTGGEDGTARLWNVQTSATIYQFSDHEGPVRSVAFSSDGRWGLTGGDDATARFWDLETGLEIRQFTGHNGPVQSVVFAANGRFVLTGSDDFTARLWDLDSGQVVQQFIGHTGQVLTAIFSPDGRSVLTGSTDQTVRLWDVETGQVVRQFPDQDGPVGTLAFSPDGQLVLAGSINAASLWRANFDEVIAITCAQLGRDFTPDERALYTIPGDEPTCPANG